MKMQVEVNGDNDGDDDKMKSWTHMSCGQDGKEHLSAKHHGEMF